MSKMVEGGLASDLGLTGGESFEKKEKERREVVGRKVRKVRKEEYLEGLKHVPVQKLPEGKRGGG